MLIFNIKRNEIAFFIKVSLEPFHGQKFASQIGLRRRIYLCGSLLAGVDRVHGLVVSLFFTVEKFFIQDIHQNRSMRIDYIVFCLQGGIV